MVELGLMGVLFAVANRQRYRTPLFGLLRQPLVSALLLTIVHTVLFVLGAFFTVSTFATVSERLDYALSKQVWRAHLPVNVGPGWCAGAAALFHYVSGSLLQPSPLKKYRDAFLPAPARSFYY
jgi:hypothetical protein